MPLSNNLVQSIIKREQDYGHIQYDRNGMPLARVHQRHSSMPTFYEYSPAPSFVSSQFEDYSNRGLSFEPVTPPQHSVGMGAEPAYIANEDTGLYTAIPEYSNAPPYNPMMQLPPSNFAGHYPSASRSFAPNAYSVVEGSPTYKQRRRRPSIPHGPTNGTPGAAHSSQGVPSSQPPSYAAHRPSDLRRSVSSSVAPAAEGDESAHDLARTYPSAMLPQKDLLQEISRHGTPLQIMEEPVDHHAVPMSNPPDDLAALPTSAAIETTVQNSTGRSDRAGPGPARRARSATMMELGPYPQKSHSCPIPSCGRLFKRLEHLKR